MWQVRRWSPTGSESVIPYKKASVMLLDLQNAEVVKSQGVLFELDDKKPDDRLRGIC